MKNSNNVLLIVAMIIIMLFIGVTTLQYTKINDLKEIINKTDTTTKKDTLFLDKIVKDTVPKVQWKKIIERDTLWKDKGDSAIAEPILISYQKKK